MCACMCVCVFCVRVRYVRQRETVRERKSECLFFVSILAWYVCILIHRHCFHIPICAPFDISFRVPCPDVHRMTVAQTKPYRRVQPVDKVMVRSHGGFNPNATWRPYNHPSRETLYAPQHCNKTCQPLWDQSDSDRRSTSLLSVAPRAPETESGAPYLKEGRIFVTAAEYVVSIIVFWYLFSLCNSVFFILQNSGVKYGDWTVLLSFSRAVYSRALFCAKWLYLIAFWIK